ncbi:hypothetical protein [Phenylobacterium sp.]|jgi:hypothetical protein|uniref:hypothetical protein n=1 Tax=Phenylobacterium sp. TaxID=1871053 RepID=UPI002F9423CD
MRRAVSLAAALAVVLCGAGAAAAEPRSRIAADGAVELYAGERVTLRFTAAGPPQLVKAEAAPLTAANPPKPGQGAFPDPPAGAVVLAAGREGGQLRLKIESGLSQAFDYRARLLGAAGEVAPACTALPLLASYEQWTTPAEGVRLSDFRFRDTNEVVCYPAGQPPLAK